MNKEKEIIKQALELVEFGLDFNVDYISLLEELQKVLKGERVKIEKESMVNKDV